MNANCQTMARTASAVAILCASTSLAMAQDPVEITIGLIFSPTTPMVECGAAPLEEDERLAAAGLDVNVVHSAQLGSENEMTRQVSTGELDMSLAPSSMLAMWLDDLAAFEGYYLYDSVDEVFDIYKTDTAVDLLAELEQVADVRVIGLPWLYGTRNVFGNARITGPDDFEGVRMRVPDTAASIAGAESLGANAVTVAYAELYLGLQQGIADVAEAPAGTMAAESFDEVSQYYNKTAHLITASPVFINSGLWNSLTPDQQTALDEAVADGARRVRTCVEDADEAAFAKWRETGMVEIVEDVDREALAANTRAFYSGKYPWSDTYENLLRDMGKIE
ncbi:MAG: TRAP transporter substrate-binding protein DctP [Roseitalea porphyridii]|jgi:TRAP-type C4-dicarboxylate transport system substrate-binding protein|uniref:TRAP transporter substrate-binding protein DctP n=3 Tax=Roseitalea porphyridii TaxID=1852022 RepID=UPI0032F02900